MHLLVNDLPNAMLYSGCVMTGVLSLFIYLFGPELEWMMVSVLRYDISQGYAVQLSKLLRSLRIRIRASLESHQYMNACQS